MKNQKWYITTNKGKIINIEPEGQFSMTAQESGFSSDTLNNPSKDCIIEDLCEVHNIDPEQICFLKPDNEEIAKYIYDNIHLERNSVYTMYEKYNFQLTHTKGSWEYRDNNFKKIVVFKTMDDVPQKIEEIKDQLDFIS